MLPFRAVVRSNPLSCLLRRGFFRPPRGPWPLIPVDMSSLDKEFSRFGRQMEKYFDRSPIFAAGRSWQYSNEVPIVEVDGKKQMKLEIDISDFQPEDIVVKTSKNTLTISGKRKSDGDKLDYDFEFKKEFEIPDGVQTKEMKCRYTEDRFLVVEAPYAGPEKEPKDKDIPVHHE